MVVGASEAGTSLTLFNLVSSAVAERGASGVGGGGTFWTTTFMSLYCCCCCCIFFCCRHSFRFLTVRKVPPLLAPPVVAELVIPGGQVFSSDMGRFMLFLSEKGTMTKLVEPPPIFGTLGTIGTYLLVFCTVLRAPIVNLGICVILAGNFAVEMAGGGTSLGAKSGMDDVQLTEGNVR